MATPTTEQTGIVKRNPSSLDKIKAYAKDAEVQERFRAMLGANGGRQYIESIIIAVANDTALQTCSPRSIMISGMRAASLHLSVDPILKQAHLVKYKDEATLIPDYHGLIMLTEQTGWYEIPPNVFEVYEGEVVELDRFSGRVSFSGNVTTPKTLKGWCGYFKSKDGIERFLYWTNEECDAHGKKYNPGGFSNAKSAWNTDRDKMRRKTVLRQLILRWGHFSPGVAVVLENDEIAPGTETFGMPDDKNIIVIEPPLVGKNQSLKDLGFDEEPGQPEEPSEPEFAPADTLKDVPVPGPSKEELEYADACEVVGSDGEKYGTRTDIKLRWVAKNAQTTPDKKHAAEIILAWREAHPK